MAKVVVFLVGLVSIGMICDTSGFEFRVGGVRGWMKLTGEESETYNHWAGRNRFHIGDALHFKYTNDSVLVVDRDAYVNCNTSNPILRFTDSNTTFYFDRHGYFYFISGEPDQCKSGEKLIVRVMVHPFVNPRPGAAPYPMAGGGSGSCSGSGSGPSGSPWSSAGSALKVAGCFYSVLISLGFGLVDYMCLAAIN